MYKNKNASQNAFVNEIVWKEPTVVSAPMIRENSRRRIS